MLNQRKNVVIFIMIFRKQGEIRLSISFGSRRDKIMSVKDKNNIIKNVYLGERGARLKWEYF